MKMKCECEILKFTNNYADSYECVKCKRIFVITHSFKLIKEALRFE